MLRKKLESGIRGIRIRHWNCGFRIICEKSVDSGSRIRIAIPDFLVLITWTRLRTLWQTTACRWIVSWAKQKRFIINIIILIKIKDYGLLKRNQLVLFDMDGEKYSILFFQYYNSRAYKILYKKVKGIAIFLRKIKNKTNIFNIQ